nr:hypothetical protein [uncultured Flavobacterium sp.]
MKTPKVKLNTDFLFPKMSFVIGLGSVLNLAGNYFEFNTSKTAEEADFKALKSDWNNVGNDIRLSKEEFERKNYDKLCLK